MSYYKRSVTMSSQNKKRETQFHSFKYINGVTFVKLLQNAARENYCAKIKLNEDSAFYSTVQRSDKDCNFSICNN